MDLELQILIFLHPDLSHPVSEQIVINSRNILTDISHSRHVALSGCDTSCCIICLIKIKI